MFVCQTRAGLPSLAFGPRCLIARPQPKGRGTQPKAGGTATVAIPIPKLGSLPSLRAKHTVPTGRVIFHGIHHVGLLCANLEKSLEFYNQLLGLEINDDRPDDKLPYRGAWLWLGSEMIHLMELPNPDPMEGRPEHGGRDRHVCVGVQSIAPLEEKLTAAGISFTRSMSGRPALFFRDPDQNVLEVGEMGKWRE